MLKKWLREPLLHFLLIGAALFLLYGIQNDEVADDGRQIVISEADVDRLISLWERKWQRLPTDVELKGLVEAQVREEVLYREALAMGLEQNDTIVRRRLAQKVEFISSDIASQAEPSEDDLQDYLNKHTEKFKVPGRISFVQIYLNSDKRGVQAEADAELLLKQLQQPNSSIDIMIEGDAFMFGQHHVSQTEHDVARLFGKQFASSVFALPVGSWQGPLSSGYGIHLVKLQEKTEDIAPDLAEVRDLVRDEWQAEQRRNLNESFYQELRKRYTIVVESETDPATAAATQSKK